MAQPRIVIVGGGFGGLAAAKASRKTPAEVILIDRSNHHLFQPLLYQVATAVLTPSQIATPIREHSSQSDECHGDPGRSHGSGHTAKVYPGEQCGPRKYRCLRLSDPRFGSYAQLFRSQ